MSSTQSLRSSPELPLKWFKFWSVWWWPILVPSREILKCLLFLCLSFPGNWWCGNLGCVSVGSVLSSSALQIFWVVSHLSSLLCPPVYLLGDFLWLRHVQSRTSTGVFKDGCRTLSYANQGTPSKVDHYTKNANFDKIFGWIIGLEFYANLLT